MTEGTYGANASPDVVLPNAGGPALTLRRLSLGLVNDPGFQRQLPLEVNTLRGLNEPLLAAPTSFLLDDSGRVVAVVRRHVPGLRLSRVLDRHPRGLDSQTATVIAVDILTALSALHARWVGHRAVSAENVVVDAAGSCVLVDIGLAPRVPRETLDSTVGTDLAWFADLIVHCLAGHPGGHRRRPASRLKGVWLPTSLPEPLRSTLRSALRPSRGAASAAAVLAELRAAAARRFDAGWDVRARERLAASSGATATAARAPIPVSPRSAGSSTRRRALARRRRTRTAVRSAIAITLLGGGAAAGVYTAFIGGHPATTQNTKSATSSASKPAVGAGGSAAKGGSRTPAPPASMSARSGVPGTVPPAGTHPSQPTATASTPGTTTVASLSLIELAYQDEYRHEAVVIVQVDTSGTGQVTLTLKIAASSKKGVADSSPSQTASFPLQGRQSYRITYPIHSAQYCATQYWGVTAATSPLPSATVYAQLPSPHC